jgi:hypothetical protein
MSIIGAAAFVLYLVFRKKFDKPLKCDVVTKYIMLAVSIMAFAAVYIMPLAVTIAAATKN